MRCCSCRGCVWDRKGWDWDFRSRSVQARVDHEGRGEEELVKLARTDYRVPAVAGSSCNVWYHRRLRAGGICTNIRESYVPFLLSIHHRRAERRPVSPRIDYPLFAGFVHLGAGLACGFTGLAAGYAIGFVGDSVCHKLTSVPHSLLNSRHGFFSVCESIRV